MTREQEIKEVKALIKLFYNQAKCGIYNNRNNAGDQMVTIFCGDYLQLDICPYWSYFEVFGTTDDEFAKIKKYYERQKKNDED